MDTKQLVIGSVVGGVVISVLGFLLWGWLLAGFFEAQTMVSARETPIVWAAVLSALTHGLLLTLAIGWTGKATLAGGFETGALVGFLVWFGADMILYGTFEFATLNAALADSGLGLLQYGAAGAAIGAVTGRGAAESGAEAPAQG